MILSNTATDAIMTIAYLQIQYSVILVTYYYGHNIGVDNIYRTWTIHFRYR